MTGREFDLLLDPGLAGQSDFIGEPQAVGEFLLDGGRGVQFSKPAVTITRQVEQRPWLPQA
ncbi:hypothetical protein [Trichothermofontia sp.]